mmetsp:Transcript_5075/g.14914  ORF Transcript_5075/g.14914 Transcript_5075/m.14914 type:complete len:211 (+) Transcript_5075:721-1353(+)
MSRRPEGKAALPSLARPPPKSPPWGRRPRPRTGERPPRSRPAWAEPAGGPGPRCRWRPSTRAKAPWPLRICRQPRTTSRSQSIPGCIRQQSKESTVSFTKSHPQVVQLWWIPRMTLSTTMWIYRAPARLRFVRILASSLRASARGGSVVFLSLACTRPVSTFLMVDLHTTCLLSLEMVVLCPCMRVKQWNRWTHSSHRSLPQRRRIQVRS